LSIFPLGILRKVDFRDRLCAMESEKLKLSHEAAARLKRAEAMEEGVRTVLRRKIQASGHTRGDLARELGHHKSYLSLLLPAPKAARPPAGLKLSTLLALLDLLGEEPLSFLAGAFAEGLLGSEAGPLSSRSSSEKGLLKWTGDAKRLTALTENRASIDLMRAVLDFMEATSAPPPAG
jgi:hypothetical protein